MSYFIKRYHPPGTRPGTLVTRESQSGKPPIISLIDYSDEKFEELNEISPERCRLYLEQPSNT